MNPYFLTLAFLMLMTILTSSEVSKFSMHSQENQFFSSYLIYKLEKEELTVKNQFIDFRKDHAPLEDKKNPNPPQPQPPFAPKEESSSKKHSDRLKFNLDRPPNNCRINVFLLMNPEIMQKNLAKEFSLHEVWARLIRILYNEAPFYFAGCEYGILDELIKLKDKSQNFAYPDDLGTLTFENERLQHSFYCMLKGREGFPSLLDFITFDKLSEKTKGPPKKINLMFASPLILKAVFQNDQICEKLINARARLWEEIFDQEAHRLERTKDEGKNRSDYKKSFNASFTSIVNEAGLDSALYEKVFDFGLGKYGTIIYVTDPNSGIAMREKYQNMRKRKSE